MPARQFWNPEVLSKVPGLVVSDDRAGSPASNIFYASNIGEAGQVLHAPEGAPASYLMNLFDELIAAASAPEANAQQWALGETGYEIVR